MTTTHITDELVTGMSRGEALWDDQVKGFGVRRQRNAIVYVLKTSHLGRQQFITLAHHCADYSADYARSIAIQRKVALLGRSPQDLLDNALLESLTFAEVARAYMTRHALVRKRKTTLAEDCRNLDRHILPALGPLDIKTIGREEIVAFHRSRVAQPVNANRCLALLSNIFSIAEKWGWRETGSNPCCGVKRYSEPERRRALSGEELRSLSRGLRAVDPWEGFETVREDWRAVQAIRLLMLTGARLSQVLTLKWEMINWESGFARWTDARQGPSKFPLPLPALVILRRIAERKPATESAFVFPGQRQGAHFTSIKPGSASGKVLGLGPYT